MNAVTRAGNLSPYFKSTSQVVASGLRPVTAVAPGSKNVVIQPLPKTSTVHSLNRALTAGNLKISSGPAVTTQVRYAHTDIAIPDFSAYRRDDTKSPTTRSKESDESRKAFTYLIAGGGTVAGAYAAKSLVTHFVSSMAASADVLAMAKIEVNLNDIPEGKSVTFKWRGKPLFIRHRTAEEISAEQAVPVSSLRDPQHDNERAQQPKWLVVIGVCTHLGCVPIANAGDYGGYYCPCHGSHYDASGRIRKGPAPLNLEVPTHIFTDNILTVG